MSRARPSKLTTVSTSTQPSPKRWAALDTGARSSGSARGTPVTARRQDRHQARRAPARRAPSGSASHSCDRWSLTDERRDSAPNPGPRLRDARKGTRAATPSRRPATGQPPRRRPVQDLRPLRGDYVIQDRPPPGRLTTQPADATGSPPTPPQLGSDPHAPQLPRPVPLNNTRPMTRAKVLVRRPDDQRLRNPLVCVGQRKETVPESEPLPRSDVAKCRPEGP